MTTSPALRSTLIHRVSAVAAAAVLTLGLAACSDDGEKITVTVRGLDTSAG